MSSKKTDADLEWKNRVLCSDESCIGVIGKDGRCKECGKLFEGELPTRHESQEQSRPSESAPRVNDGPAQESGQAGHEAHEADADQLSDQEWDRRTLCSDETCIGVIGPDGRCKECGKPYAGQA